MDHLGFETIEAYARHSVDARLRVERAIAAAEHAGADVDAPWPVATGSAHGDSSTASGADAAAWSVLERLAELRTVSHVGSVPLMVRGLVRSSGDSGDDDPSAAVLDRLGRMSDLVQVVVTTDDAAVAAWASALGPSDASVVCW